MIITLSVVAFVVKAVTLEDSQSIAECAAQVMKSIFSSGSTIFSGFTSTYELTDDQFKCDWKIKDYNLSLARLPPKPPGVRMNQTKRTERCSMEREIDEDEVVYIPSTKETALDIFPKVKWQLCKVFRGDIFSEEENEILKQLHSGNDWKFTTAHISSPLIYQSIVDGYLLLLRHVTDVLSLMEYLSKYRLNLENIANRNRTIVAILLGKPGDKETVHYLLAFFAFVMRLFDAIVVVKGIHGEINMFSSVKDRCARFKEVKLLSTWAQGRFIKQFKYEKQEFSSFKGCRLIVRAFNNSPLVTFDEEERSVDGLEIRLLGLIATHLRMIMYVYAFRHPMNAEIWSGGMRLFSFRDFAHIERYYVLQYEWFVPLAEAYPRWSSLTRVFSATVWIFTMLSSVLIGLTISFSQNLHQRLSGARGRMIYFLDIWAVFLGVSVEMPLWTPLRVVFLTWVIFSIAFSMIFQAFMTSYFTDPGRQHQIDSYEELMESNLSLAFDSLPMLAPYIYRVKRGSYLARGGTFRLLLFSLQNPNVAMMTGVDLFEYALSNIKCDLNSKATFHRIRGYFVEEDAKFMVMTNSPYLFRVNQLTKRLVEAGIPSKLMKTLTNPKGINHGIKYKDELDDYSPLSTFHIFGPLLFLGLGYLISLAGFVIEVILVKMLQFYKRFGSKNGSP